MELIFPQQPSLPVLCFAGGGGQVLMTPQGSGITGTASVQSPHQGAAAGQDPGGGTTRPAAPNSPKGYSTPYDFSSDIKA